MRFISTGIFFLVVACAAASARGAEASDQQLDEAAKHLGDADPRVRNQAAEMLRAAGPAAEAALRAAAEGEDPEAARRAAALLRQIRRPALEEPPEVELPEMRAYRGADRDAKAQLIERLGTGHRAAALVRLWKEEEDGELRALMFNAMLRSPAAFATAYLADGNVPGAERLLDAALDQGNAEAAASYAALCLLRGRTDEAIAQWSARVPPADAKAPAGGAAQLAAVVLTRLHRAAGDSKAAVDAARRAGDPALLEEALLDARDWPALAEVIAARQTPVVRPKQLGMLAGAHHLAGNELAFDDTVTRMRNIATPESLDDVAEVLLLTGRIKQGTALLAGGGSATAITQLKLLAARERWDEVWALVDSQDEARDESALRLRVAAADQWYALGEEKRAADLLARVAGENQALNSPAVHAMLGQAYRRLGKADEAWAQFGAAIKVETERNGDAGRVVWLALQADLDEDGDPDANGNNLWEFVRARFRSESIEAQLGRARAIVERTVPLAELKTFGQTGRRGDAGQGFRAYAAGLHTLIGQRIKEEGQDAEAERYVAAAAERAPAPEYALQLYVRLGDWAADKQDWAKASHWYGRAWNADRSRPAPLYLRAWALRQAGFPARAGELTSLAHVLPLADAWRRREALKHLHERRLDAALAGEIDVILRTARPDVVPADMAQQLSADRAGRAGDWLAAAAWRERSTLNYMGLYDLVDPVAYLRIPHTIHRERARGRLAKGDVETAEREIAACRSTLPGDVMLPIDVVPELERLGKKAHADDLYRESMAAHDAALAKYPNSANHHNNAAWLAVNCGRDSDKALAHARRAVELRPKSAAYLDTLAELQFREGQFDAAIKTMRRCVELQPKMPRHREQIERFEAGKRGEKRPMPPS